MFGSSNNVSTKIIPLNFGTSQIPNSAPYQCEVIRSNRKTLAIHVQHQRVEVRVPMFASKREVNGFIERNYEWIQQRLEAESSRFEESLRVEHGRTVSYRARELQIEFRQGRKRRVLIEGKTLVIQGHKLTPAKAKEQLAEFLQAKAAAYIPDRARALAAHLGIEDRLKRVRFRKTKTKWGHCTSEGTIQFNWLIMLAPYAIIDYIIIHEVCHLIHMNHSRRYWKKVESLCPEYKDYIEWLRINEHRLWF